jgi:hypothetical protein
LRVLKRPAIAEIGGDTSGPKRMIADRRKDAGSLPIAIYILICAIIGLVSTALLTDYTNKEISAEYEGV